MEQFSMLARSIDQRTSIHLHDEVFDCIVIGAGPAGLSASLFLARYRHRVLTFHHNSPRNEYAHGVHGFLGHDGIPPTELLARGRDEVTAHGGLIVEACVTSVEKTGNQFLVLADEKKFEARSILLATGLRDLTPDCPGFREFYGYTVHHCPDCDGYEATSKRVAVLGNGRKTAGFALGMLTWSNSVTLLTDGDPGDIGDEERARLAKQNIEILQHKVKALEGDRNSKQLHQVLFENDERLRCDVLFFNLGTVPASDLHEMLGCNLDPECGLVWVDHEQQTSVPGVFAAGDITPNSQLAIVAAAEGAMAAIQIHQRLMPAEWKLSK